MSKLTNAFDEIKATEELKRNTADFISNEISRRAKKTKSFRYVVAACSFLCVAIMAVVGYSLVVSPVSAISIDINPSIELELNVFDRVVSASTFNDDGKLIMENIKVDNLEYTEAVEKILADEVFKGYIKEDSLLVITVASDRKAEIISGIENTTEYEKIAETALETKVEEAEKETISEAHDCGLSFGKYQAYMNLKQYDIAVTPESVASMSMREIKDKIEELSGEKISMNEVTGGGSKGEGTSSSCENEEPETCESESQGSGNGNGIGTGGGSGKENGNGKGYKGGK